MNTPTYQNITTVERGARIAAGLAMIGFVLAQTGPVGLSALLPLIAIYPILTGFLGWEPLYSRTSGERKSRAYVDSARAHHA